MLTKIKQWILRKIIERRIIKMLDNLKVALDGKKTYITAGIGVLIALVGVLWGPVQIGPITIPQESWNDFFTVLWQGGLFTFLHMKS